MIAKNHPSAFAGTGLHEYLKGEGVKKVVLVGYMVWFSCLTKHKRLQKGGLG